MKTLHDTFLLLQSSLEAKTAEVADSEKAYATLKSQHEAFHARFSSKQELLQTLQTGLADSANTSGGGYLGQLADAKARVVQGETMEEQARRNRGLVERELGDARGRWKKVEREAAEGRALLEGKKKEAEGLERKVKSMGWSEEMEVQSGEELRKARGEVRALTEVGSIRKISALSTY
jgi:structural maintenance of chromosome 2